jgi:hypothetical protein
LLRLLLLWAVMQTRKGHSNECDEETDMTVFVPAFLGAARDKDNPLSFRGRIIAYSFALAYEEDRDTRLEYTDELANLLKELL